MKKFPTLLIAAPLTGAIGILPAFAEDAAPTAPAETMKNFSRHLSRNDTERIHYYKGTGTA